MDPKPKNFAVFALLYVLTTLLTAYFVKLNAFFVIAGGSCYYTSLPFPTTGVYGAVLLPEQLKLVQETHICTTSYLGIILNIVFPIASYYLVFIKKIKLAKWLLALTILTAILTFIFEANNLNMLQIIN